MEFGFRLHSELLIVPRGSKFTGTAQDNSSGMPWTTKYGYVGMNQSFAPTFVSDGMNEKGLVVGALYLPRLAQYQAPNPAQVKETLGPWELPSFLLATCASVADVKAVLSSLLVAEIPLPGMGDFVLPLHYYICDADGNALVVEYIKGKREVHDNPLGVLTNSPAFAWHLTNLSNYVNLSPKNVRELTLPHWTSKSLGEGSGLLGLPGDYTPPSRFVRAAFFSNWAQQPNNAIDAVRTGFHILNTFDIFDGIVRPQEGPGKNEITEWVIVHDRTHRKTYFRGYYSLKIQMVDLNEIEFDRAGFKMLPIAKSFFFEDMTPRPALPTK